MHEPLEIEKIERRSAFQNELSAEEGMLAEFGEQFAQARDFLEIVGWKIRVACASFVICAALNFTCAPSFRRSFQSILNKEWNAACKSP